jgi:hypothetical protein
MKNREWGMEHWKRTKRIGDKGKDLLQVLFVSSIFLIPLFPTADCRLPTL